MGVRGLWKLIEECGDPVKLESLEGQILAVDISIWLNMAIKGIRGYDNNTDSHAYLVTLFNRICKLLYFGVKPIFVFDGKMPALKKKALEERCHQKGLQIRKSKSAAEKILQNYLKRHAIHEVSKSNKEERCEENAITLKLSSITDDLKKKMIGKTEDSLYKLPPVEKHKSQLNSSDEEAEIEWDKTSKNRQRIYQSLISGDQQEVKSVDTDSRHFNKLPVEVQHEMLVDIKEIRKRARTQIEEMPEHSEHFSDFQLSGLLTKHKLSEKIRQVEKIMKDRNVEQVVGCHDHQSNFQVDINRISYGHDHHYVFINRVCGNNNNNNVIDDDVINHVRDNKREVICNEIINLVEDGNDLKTHDEIKDENKNSINGKSFPNFLVQSVTSSSQAVTSSARPVQNTTTMHEVTLSPSSDCHAVTYSSASVVNDRLMTSSTPEPFGSVRASSSFGTQSRMTLKVDDKDREGNLGVNVLISYQPEPLHPVIDQFSNHFTSPPRQADAGWGHHDVIIKRAQSYSTNFTDLPTEVMQPAYLMASSAHNDVVTDDKKTSSSEHVAIDDISDDSDDDFINVALQVIGQPATIDVADEFQTSTLDGVVDLSQVDESANAGLISDNHIIDNVDGDDPWGGVTPSNLDYVTRKLNADDVDLLRRMRAGERAARDMNDDAIQLCQQLLQLFGLPYIISPQEAEAQCAYMDAIEITSGTITEDSDVWLFGATRVYKNMFHRTKPLTCYKSQHIMSSLGLDRELMICVAMCSGCDYTSGIKGVGPVSALEILKEFRQPDAAMASQCGMDCLTRFREWWELQQKQPKLKKMTPIKQKLRNSISQLPPEFPSNHVRNAFLLPHVDQSQQAFTWGFPDLDGIRDFAQDRMGLAREKIDGQLLPVLKKASERSSKARQTKITNFTVRSSTAPYSGGVKRSKRVQRAADGLLRHNISQPPPSLAARGRVKDENRRGVLRKRVNMRKQKLIAQQQSREKIDLGLSESSSDDD